MLLAFHSPSFTTFFPIFLFRILLNFKKNGGACTFSIRISEKLGTKIHVIQCLGQGTLFQKGFIQLLYKVTFCYLSLKFTLFQPTNIAQSLKSWLYKSCKATEVLFISNSQRPYLVPNSPIHMPNSYWYLVMCRSRSYHG